MSYGRTLIKLREFQIFNTINAPYSHPSMTGTTVGAALNWLFSAVYPNSQPSVNSPGDLPLVGNTLNDYRIVLDDGDGKSAGYRWEQREGDASPAWYKTHDMDWSNDAILSAFIDQTLDLYVSKYGRQDLDDSGNPITGLFEGQSVYGGSTSGNLTLHANAGDPTSDPADQTGHIQFHGDTRPTYDDVFDLGTALERFRNLYLSGDLTNGTDIVSVSELKEAYDHSQIITGNPHNTGYDDLSNQLGTLTVDGDASGSIDLSTSGDKTLTLTVANDSHTHDAATTITNFDSEVYNYLKTALVDTSEITWIYDDGLEEITADITIDSVSNIDDPLVDTILVGNATSDNWDAVPASITLIGDVTGSASYNTADQGWTITADVEAVGVDKIAGINLKNKTYTVTPGNPTIITATAHGLNTGDYVDIYEDDSTPTINGSWQITRIDANNFSIAVTTTVTNTLGYYIPDGAHLLYDANIGEFQVAKEYEDIRLGELSGLDEDVLDIYVAKDGRSGGQTVIGGISASESLILESTSNVTKGTIQAKDTFTPFTDASYSGGWSGANLGSSGKRWNDLFIAGEIKGLRFENVGSLPTPSGTSIGKAVYYNSNLYVDTGSAYVKVGSSDISVSTKTSDYTITTADDVILVNGTYTITLPPASGITKAFTIKNIGTGVVTIDGDGSELIDGAGSYEIQDQYHSLKFVSSGTGWFIV